MKACRPTGGDLRRARRAPSPDGAAVTSPNRSLANSWPPPRGGCRAKRGWGSFARVHSLRLGAFAPSHLPQRGRRKGPVKSEFAGNDNPSVSAALRRCQLPLHKGALVLRFGFSVGKPPLCKGGWYPRQRIPGGLLLRQIGVWRTLGPLPEGAAERSEAGGVSLPPPRRRKLRIVRPRASARTHSLRCSSFPHKCKHLRGPHFCAETPPSKREA